MHKRSHFQWPGSDDRAVVEEMLTNSNSDHWVECRNFIQKLVQGANLPTYLKEEVVQNTMISVAIGLSNFRFSCRLTYWLYTITNKRIIDMARKHSYDEQWTLTLNNPSEDTGNEMDTLKVHAPKTTEEECLIREELREVDKEILAYLETRSKRARDQRILKMAWIDGLSHEEIAKRVGVSAPVVGYVVRSAQSYLRKKLKHLPPPESTT